MSDFKPLLAVEVDLSKLDYSNLWLSPKLDGIRAIVIKSVVMSRSMKPIPSKMVQVMYGKPEYNGFDGELIVGDPTSPTVYNDTYSGVMKKSGQVEADFYVFDHIEDPELEYHRRYEMLSGIAQPARGLIIRLEQTPVEDPLALDYLEGEYLRKGYEGVMLRKYRGPKSKYKFGRSTPTEGTLLKLKRFSDKEAVIIGFEEEMANNNEATTDELGRTKRSSHQENKVGKGRLGALICRTPEGVTFNIGTGFTAEQRLEMWLKQESLLSCHVKYKSFDIGVVNAPRFPVYLGLRSPLDM